MIKTILTDNGKEFTNRLFGSRAKEPSGEHEFDLLCDSLGIDHRLIRAARRVCRSDASARMSIAIDRNVLVRILILDTRAAGLPHGELRQ